MGGGKTVPARGSGGRLATEVRSIAVEARCQMRRRCVYLTSVLRGNHHILMIHLRILGMLFIGRRLRLIVRRSPHAANVVVPIPVCYGRRRRSNAGDSRMGKTVPVVWSKVCHRRHVIDRRQVVGQQARRSGWRKSSHKMTLAYAILESLRQPLFWDARSL